MVRKIVAASVLALGLACSAAFGWGNTGHKAIVEIAAARLTPAAQKEVAALLGSPDALTGLTQYASWADEIRRGRGDTKNWHFVDIPVGEAGYDPARDCDKDDCIVAQIHREIAMLKDKSLAEPVRAEALRFLIHFVGDIHQPLHSADNQDRGGNEVKVMAGERKTNLHSVWDTATVNAIDTDPDKIAALLGPRITPELAAKWSASTPEDWANESFLIAKTKIYPDFPGSGTTLAPIVLKSDYTASMGPITAMQLAKAGVRLAAVLNEVFAPPGLVTTP